MLIADLVVNDAPPLLTMAAPLLLTTGFVPLVLQADAIIEKMSLHPLDSIDPAGWSRSDEWLLDSTVQKEYALSSSSSSSVAEHRSGRWRTLRRHGSVQSVTLMQPSSEEDYCNESLVPFHSSVGNEYLKVMASAYAALTDCGSSDDDGINDFKQKGLQVTRIHQPQETSSDDGGDRSSLSSSSIMHLGLGGGSLPMLLGEPCTAIELDEETIDLAIKFCGLDPELVSIVRGGDALNHKRLVPGPHSCVFVDVFGSDNNVPPPFVEEEFVRGLWDSLEDGGLVIANFHCNSDVAKNEEDRRLDKAAEVYSRVFEDPRGGSSLVKIPSRYQGNMILCAKKGSGNGPSRGLSPEDFDIEKARQLADRKGWLFDPGARLKKAETVSLPLAPSVFSSR